MRLFCYFFLASVCCYSQAKQLSFDKEMKGDDYHFHYQWLDAKKQSQQFTFTLNTTRVNNDFRHFKALRPSLLQMHSVRKLKEAASKLDPKKGYAVIRPRVDSVEYEIRSRDQSWIRQQSEKLSQVYQASLSEYLYQEYYTDFPGFHQLQAQKVYKPDHIRFAKESQDAVMPIVAKLKQTMPRANARSIAVYLLSWLQTIPYSPMESRAEANGSGFVPPLRLIDNNLGDCDSKVTLMATIMKAMFPRLRIAIVYIPNHALIGMNVSHLEEDEKLELDGLDYTLSEPVGPAVMPFATISARSRRYIESGNYKIELL